jgi:hypothetical protein
MSTPPVTPPPPPGSAAAAELRKPAAHDGMAISSMVLGILWLWGLGSILAVIFGHVHLSAAKKDGRNPSGMAIAGLVLGYLGIVGALIITILIIVAAHDASTLNSNCVYYSNC